MDPNIPILKFLFRDEWSVLAESFHMNPGLESESIANVNELVSYISGVDASLVLVSVTKKDDLLQLAQAIKAQKKIAPSALVKFAIINFSSDRSYENPLAKLGIQDIIDPKINAKALRFKVDFMMKSLKAQVKSSHIQDVSKSIKQSEQDAAVNDHIVKQQKDRISSYTEGSAKTDHIKNGPLSGKSSTDDLSTDLLSLELKKASSSPQGRNLTVTPEEERGFTFKSGTQQKVTTYYGRSNPAPAMEEDVIEGEDVHELDLDEVTATATVKAELIIKNEKMSCSLDDFFDGHIIIITDSFKLKEKMKCSLALSFDYLEKETKLKLEGAVTHIEPDPEGKNYVTVELRPDQVKEFGSFMKLYKQRQKGIDIFIKMARGVA